MRDIETRKGMTETTELDAEFDLINELKTALTEIENAIKNGETDNLEGSFSYTRFLLDALDNTLSGEFEPLRHQRFITKKSQ